MHDLAVFIFIIFRQLLKFLRSVRILGFRIFYSDEGIFLRTPLAVVAGRVLYMVGIKTRGLKVLVERGFEVQSEIKSGFSCCRKVGIQNIRILRMLYRIAGFIVRIDDNRIAVLIKPLVQLLDEFERLHGLNLIDIIDLRPGCSRRHFDPIVIDSACFAVLLTVDLLVVHYDLRIDVRVNAALHDLVFIDCIRLSRIILVGGESDLSSFIRLQHEYVVVRGASHLQFRQEGHGLGSALEIYIIRGIRTAE